MPFIHRFTQTTNGAITFTGNTLGFADGSTDIGAFVSIDTSKQVSGFPAGSTFSWQENSSAAELRFPAGSEILYAELIWGGSTRDDSTDISGSINTSIWFRTPSTTITIAPDSYTAREETSNGQVFYVRSANVTDYVRSAGAGTYIVGGVPASIRDCTFHGSTNTCGWTLAVVYKHPALKIRNMNIYVGSQLITMFNPPVDELIYNFKTPEGGEIKGRVMLTAMEGNANLPGDHFEFGPNRSSLSVISGPNNPAENFFASQINDDLGYLDTSGTAGGLNKPVGSDGFGVRSGWDITNVDVTHTLYHGQTEAIARIATRQDTYLVSGYGVQIDANSPIVKMTKSSDKKQAVVGEIITYTLEVKNDGYVDATNVIFKDHLDSELEYVPDSLRVRGEEFESQDIENGVNIGDLSVGETVRITYQAKITKEPEGKVVHNQASMTFDFQSRPDLPISTATSVSNKPGVEVIEPPNCEDGKNQIMNTIAEAEHSIARILRAEAEKIEAAARAFGNLDVWVQELVAVNDSVADMLDSVIALETELKEKLAAAKVVCNFCS
ncbi:DUF11 domain-containing protein [Paenibacillus sp. SC116]|uniref:DUF11 domain-containing protein n=1 Tax=Paenibacillus sp. SC116 TaxID=2968986 RepID=UPI00215A2BC2|nr:DUF11 domain-containing protein [Paenibacillus sp. SC116]MCR8842657.1 DUF11 domain-containing protein [Paenibacillus sp. SC116]